MNMQIATHEYTHRTHQQHQHITAWHRNF